MVAVSVDNLQFLHSLLPLLSVAVSVKTAKWSTCLLLRASSSEAEGSGGPLVAEGSGGPLVAEGSGGPLVSGC